MRNAFAYHHIRALQLASACVELGARIQTVALVTGLRTAELRRLFYSDVPSASGRRTDLCNWYHEANLVLRAEACVFACICSTLVTRLRCPQGEALVQAYRLYRERCAAAPRLTFERAFNLQCNLQGVWTTSAPQLALRTCRHCGARHLAAIGDVTSDLDGCVFCKLVKGYHRLPRVRTHVQRQAMGALHRRCEQSP